MKHHPKLLIAGLFVLAATLVLIGISLGLYTVIKFLLPIIGWFAPSLQTQFYDLGAYGAHPTEGYVSFNLTSPLFNHLKWDEQCDDGLVLLTPRGSSVKPPGPLIVDASGRLVWTSAEFGSVTNLKVQEYKGQNFLTFWSGKQDTTFGDGIYHMLDSSYRSIYQVAASGEGIHGDLHEFKITKDGTALMSIYNVTTMDLTPMGRPVKGWIIDSIFQEIDIESGELVFEWRASEHFDSTDSYATNPFAGYREGTPFDFFHINSVEKDSAGNFLVSSRHTHTITTVDGKTGEIIWVLGGERNEFKDLSNGEAITFSWQHDARWVSEDEGILTLFDNGEAGPLHIDAPYSRGMMLKLNVANRTVELLHEYISLEQTRTPSQGSVQILPNTDNVFVGWGHSAAFSEFKTDGTLLCESHFGASWYYWWGRIVSYRAMKTTQWIGTPEYSPAAKIHGFNLFVSWNGATEVAAWELQGATEEGDEFHVVDVMDKIGFESSFVLPAGTFYTHYRVAALDREGRVLRYSNVTQKELGRTMMDFLIPSVLLGAVVFAMRILYRVNKGRLGTNVDWTKYRYSPL